MSRSFADPILQRIADFLGGIGIPVAPGTVTEQTFLPGILIRDAGLTVDETRAYPSDLLHEAGHLAVVPPERRGAMDTNAGDDGGEEMAAIAWSWAATKHLGLPPEVLFHADGYKGGAASLIENFTQGNTMGVPLLDWVGLTVDPNRRNRDPDEGPLYPQMRRWLRE